MRIGILIKCNKSIGGTYYYYISFLELLKEDSNKNVYFIFYSDHNFPVNDYKSDRFHFIEYFPTRAPFRIRVYNKIIRYLNVLLSILKIDVLLMENVKNYNILNSFNLDYIITTAPIIDPYYSKIPFISIIHDLWFLDNNKISGAYNRVDDILRKKYTFFLAKKSTIILVESNHLKNQVEKYYSINNDNIFILPTGPASFIWNYDSKRDQEVKLKYGLSFNYIFYPAHFIRFKNHERILQALNILKKEYNLSMHLVLSGTSSIEPDNEIVKMITSYGLSEYVHVLGYIPDEDMPLIYKSAICLCMASYLGPTNMPIWEALVVGCPVIASSIKDHAWQTGSSALLFDPDDANQLAEQLYRLYSNKELKDEMIKEGYKQGMVVSNSERIKIVKNIFDIITVRK
jgi:glycosyltransferase involved in cell wall biosynthesis